MIGLAIVAQLAAWLPFGWTLLGVCIAIATVAEIAEAAAGATGAKLGGATRRGMVGAFVGGFLADALGFGKGAAGGGDVVNIYSIVVAVIGAVIAVVVFNMLTRRRV